MHIFTVCSRSSNGCARTHKSSYSLVSGFFFRGIPQRLLRTEVSYFYSMLLSPVDRGSELRVPCPQTPAMLAISLLLVNELKWTRDDMLTFFFFFLSLMLITYAKNPVCSSVGVCLACGETWWLEAAAFSADHIGDSRG